MTASRRGIARLWLAKIEDLRDAAIRSMGRNLTWQEWRRYLGDRPYELTCPDLPPHSSAVEAGVAEEGGNNE